MTQWQIEPLGRHHVRSQFSCGIPALDDFARTQITQYEKRGLCRSRVVTDESGAQVLGFYTLSAGGIAVENMPPDVARRLPEHPVPVILLGRLAVDKSVHNKGIGRRMLRDAISRSLQLSSEIGIFAIYVRATGESAAAFYRKYGFASCSLSPLDLYLPIASLMPYDPNAITA